MLKALRDDWQVKVLNSEGAYKQANLRYENQITKRETELSDALDQLTTAQMRREVSAGTRDLVLSEKSQEVDLVAESVKVQQLVVAIAEAMQRIGTHSIRAGTPEEERYQYQLEVIKLGQALGDLEMAKKYDHPLQAAEMEAAVKSAQQALARSQSNHEAILAQLLAQRTSAEKILATQRDRLRHYEDQLEKCHIRAPHDGVVMYAVSDEGEPIEAGAVLHERQKIATLCNPAELELNVSLPPEDADRVRVDMPAAIQVDLDNDEVYPGVVTALTGNGKEPGAVVKPQKPLNLRLGDTATVEIQLKQLPDVLQIPILSYISRDGNTIVYVRRDGDWQPQPVELGAAGMQYVQVVEGLQEGETIARDASVAASLIQDDPGTAPAKNTTE